MIFFIVEKPFEPFAVGGVFSSVILALSVQFHFRARGLAPVQGTDPSG